MAFLCTQVRDPDTDNKKKLAKVRMYLQATLGLPLIPHIDNSGKVQWYIDSAFPMHNDIKSHIRISMTMGKGSIYSSSQKQILNGKRLTEVELIGVDNGMNQVL